MHYCWNHIGSDKQRVNKDCEPRANPNSWSIGAEESINVLKAPAIMNPQIVIIAPDRSTA
jgi:hypothetical protein